MRLGSLRRGEWLSIAVAITMMVEEADAQDVVPRLAAKADLVLVATELEGYRIKISNIMAAFAAARGIKLMCYGTLMGGLLSEKWHGRGPPTSRADLPTASLGKYYRFLTAWGDWDLFQELLSTLKAIGKRHGEDVTTANVAVRWVLQQQRWARRCCGCILDALPARTSTKTNGPCRRGSSSRQRHAEDRRSAGEGQAAARQRGRLRRGIQAVAVDPIAAVAPRA
jgi:hypothetical protein